MRIALNRVESDCLKPIYDNVHSKEETLELVVPDVCADVGKILDVRGQFLLSSQKSKTDEIYISASVEVTVIYAAEDSGKVQIVTAAIPFDHTIPVEGANDNSKITARCDLCSIDARTLNPRKLLIRANALMHICAYSPDKFVIWDNLSENEEIVHVLQKEAEHCLVVGVREKSFTVSDEYSLPEDKGKNLKMLSADTNICVQDAKAVGNKLVLKAEAETTAVFLDDVECVLFSSVFVTQFSQIVEVDTFGENIEDTAIIQLRDAEFTFVPGKDEGYTVAAQLYLNAQVISRERKFSVYVADAYCNENKLNSEAGTTKLMKFPVIKTLKLNMREKLQQKASLEEIFYVAATAVCAGAEGSDIVVKADISGIGKSDEGELESISLELRAEENIGLTKNQRINILSVCAEQPTVIGAAHNADISIDIVIDFYIGENIEINAVSGIDADEECSMRGENKPSLVVICSERETDLWSLAKKYGSTMEMIKDANTVDGNFSISKRPLIIPRASR